MEHGYRGSPSESPQASVSQRLKSDAHQVLQLNTSVYELYSPPGTPTMEVLFFHGFQDGVYDDAHISTWRCGDGSESIWPQTWLVEKFSGARVLSVSYNASILKSCKNGTIDMYIIRENLTSDLLSANIGQERCRPLVLVGHSFGGLVIKQICVFVSSMTGQLNRNSEKSVQLSAFLENVKGIFFYSTPHQGILGNVADHFVAKGPLLEYVKTLSTPRARVNFEFDNLCGQQGQYKMWQIAGLGEGLPTKRGRFNDIVVKEASARYGTSFNIVERADHISVCKPTEKTSRSFSALTEFLEGIDSDSQAIVHGLPNYPTALEQRVFEVQQKLTNTPVVGIVGMGGIGKTTIAKKLFNCISQQFEYTCFVDNVKSIKVHKLSKQILSQFLRNGTRVEFIRNGVSVGCDWSDLGRKKCLIMMDDVDSENQVRILPRLDEFGSGSRLIFTTRDEGVLKALPNCVIHEVDFLKFDEAKELFCRHAFEHEAIPDSLMETDHHLEEKVKKIVQKCDGLPLTLEVLGSYLRSHRTNTRVWEETLNKFGKAQSVDGVRNDRVWSSLKVSYDALSPEEQGMFKEAGTYFFQQPVERALAAWSTAYGNSESRWANLLRTSMVKEVPKTGRYWGKDVRYTEVWVHEHLRDLAIHLSNGAIVSRSVGADVTAVDLLNAVEAQTCILRLSLEGRPEPELQSELLDKFQQLKYVELINVVPPRSGKNLSRNEESSSRASRLRAFLDGVSPLKKNKLKVVPPAEKINYILKKLCLLKWHSSSHTPPLLPISLEDMNDVAILELENLEIPEESLAGLGKLSNLQILSLSNVPGPAHLLENFGHLSKLKRLELSDVELTALPHSFGNLSALEHLVLHRLQVVELPNSFGSLSSLATLSISGCKRLASLPESFGHLSSLTQLVILHSNKLNCNQTTELTQFDLSGNLPSLTYLHVEECESLERLPACFGFLSSLEELKVGSGTGLRTLPESIGQCKDLKTLKIQGVDHLEALPDSFGNLAALTDLTLSCCGSLDRLPASVGNLSALQKLSLYECDRFQRLPDNFGQLKALERLSIEGCNKLEALSDGFGNLPSLIHLSLRECDGLKKLPDSFGLLSALQELELTFCGLERLPDNFGQLSALKTLRLEGNHHLEALPDSLGDLSALEFLYISVTGGQRLPQSIGQLHKLRKLHVRGNSLRSLPEELGNLSSLETLKLHHSKRIETLPDSLGRISSLRTVILFDCDGLKSLPDTWGNNFSPHGHRSTETRSLVAGQSSLIASTGFLLYVDSCYGIRYSEFEDWIEFDDKVPYDVDDDTDTDGGYSIFDHGSWYQIQWHGEDNTSALNQLN